MEILKWILGVVIFVFLAWIGWQFSRGLYSKDEFINKELGKQKLSEYERESRRQEQEKLGGEDRKND